MATIVTRETGPSSVNRVLSNGELDQNFINLNTDKLELAQTYSSAVANGIPYFNNTKVLVTSSTFVFDGTNIGLGIDPIPYTAGNRVFEINGLSSDSEIRLTNTATGHAAGVGGLSIRQVSNDSYIWNAGTGKLSLGAGNSSVLEISNSGAVTIGGNTVVTSNNIGTYALPIGGGTLTGTLTVPASLTVNASGAEGGEIVLKKGTGQTSLSGDVIVDTLSTIFRVFENGGTFRQFNFNLSNGNITGANGIVANINGNAATATSIVNNNIVDFLRITNTGGAQRLLMGNQDSGGVNNPSMIVAANGSIELGNGNSWTGSGGTFTRHATFNTSGAYLTGQLKVGSSTTSGNYRFDVTSTLAGAQADKTIVHIADLYNAGANGQFFKIMGGASGINLLSGWGNLVLGARTGDGNDTFTSHLVINGSGTVNIPNTLQQGGNQVLHAGNVSTYALPISGGALTGTLSFTSNGSRPALRLSNWGYGSNYKALVIGSTSTSYNTDVTGSVSLAFNYDPVNNTNSSFFGDGRELIFRRGTRFVTPNSADNAWNLYNLVLLDGKVGIGLETPTYKLDIDGQVRLGQNVTQAAPSATDILSTAHVMLGGNGGNYLTIGQYPADQSFAQWIQSSYINPTTAVYNLVLQPLGGNVGIGINNPGAKLVVNGSGNIVRLGDGTNTHDIRFQGPNNWDLQLNTTTDIFSIRRNSVSFLGVTSDAKIVVPGTMTAWDVTTPGQTTGSIHIGTASTTANSGGSITFGARDASSGTNAQAGIYIISGGSFGTRMYLATTDLYSAGAKNAISISETGVVNFIRARPTYAGNVILDANNYGGYALPLTGGTLTGQVTINAAGSAGSPSLRINTSTSSTFVHIQENLAANLTAGQTALSIIGQAASTKNSGYIGYYWAGAGSNSNFVSIGHWGADHLFRVYGDGSVTVGGSTTIGGRAVVSPSGRTTSYTGSSLELYTNDNTPPGISFHRGGYSATLLYENDGEIYANAWTTRSQTGKLLSSGNYTEYTLPKGGSWYGTSGIPGTRWGGFSANGGEIVFGQDLPNVGQMGILIDGCYIASENNGFWSLGDGTWGSRRGMRWDGDFLDFTTNAPISRFSNLRVDTHIRQGADHAHPNVEWSYGGGSTGMVIFKLPGTSGNYGMVHMVFDYYEYVSGLTATIIVGGHNWQSGWYQVGCNVIGNLTKEVRLGYVDGQYCVVFGTAGSTWSYGTIRLRKIHNGSFYNNIMDLGGTYSVVQTTSATFTNITGDLRELRTPASLTVGGTTTSSNFAISSDTTNRFIEGNLILRGTSPTVYLRDIDHNSAMLHCNSNTFYVLRGGNDTETYNTVGSGWWPMELNLTNNNAQFGGNVTAANDFIGLRFVDRNDGNYYVDPHATSVLNALETRGGGYRQIEYLDAPGSPGTYVWVRASMGSFNGGGDTLRFSVGRSINDNGSSPYGGPSAEFTAHSREWHNGQECCMVYYSEHGAGSGAGGYYITHAGPRDLAGGGYWFYMRLEGGIRYIIYKHSSSSSLGTFASTTDPGSVPQITNWGLSLLGNASTLRADKGRFKQVVSDYHSLNSAYYGGGGTPSTGYLITTNIDYSSFNMPTVIIEGYAYGNSVPIHLEIVFYSYNDSWTNMSYTNLGAWHPGNITIGTNASGKVCIHLSNNIYYGRFNVRCIYDSGHAALEDWSVSTATTSGLTRLMGIGQQRLRTSITGNVYNELDSTYRLEVGSSTSLRTIGDWRADSIDWTGEFNGKIQYHANNWYLQAAGGWQFRKSDGNQAMFCDQSGNLTAAGNVTAYSDIRLKKNIQTITNPLDIVNRLRGVTFDWIDTNKHSYGLIAQEVETVLPELVVENVPDPNSVDRDKTIIKSVDYSKMVSVLIEAVKEQDSIIKQQNARLEALEKLIGLKA